MYQYFTFISMIQAIQFSFQFDARSRFIIQKDGQTFHNLSIERNVRCDSHSHNFRADKQI